MLPGTTDRLRDIARLCLLRAAQGIRQGFFRDEVDVAQYVEAMETLHVDPTRTDIAFRLGIGADLLDPARRLGELRRFIDECVKERKYVL